jgi:hypothetical protein
MGAERRIFQTQVRGNDMTTAAATKTTTRKTPVKTATAKKVTDAATTKVAAARKAPVGKATATSVTVGDVHAHTFNNKSARALWGDNTSLTAAIRNVSKHFEALITSGGRVRPTPSMRKAMDEIHANLAVANNTVTWGQLLTDITFTKTPGAVVPGTWVLVVPIGANRILIDETGTVIDRVPAAKAATAYDEYV